jgi:tetratricopeptide (TPR) repeat protein/transcriptional regulator with XRE-family HTH domain
MEERPCFKRILLMSCEHQICTPKRARTDRIPNERLKAQRLKKNWTQVYVATRIGTSDVEVSRWETGGAVPSLYFRKQLCALFGCTPEELGFVSPARGESEASKQAAAPWNMPSRRNPLFTGREEVLRHLHTLLHSGKTVALTQVQAISGLGGIGKTQTAIEYAYRHRQDYSAVLWVKADTPEVLTSDFAALASTLHLAELTSQDQHRAIQAVKRWLVTHDNWLVILDNVEDVTLFNTLPSTEGGYVLLTTRSQMTGPFAHCLDLEQMTPEEGALFLLRRAKFLEPDAPLGEACQADQDAARAICRLLDGLPLALDQAGAYIEETACSLSSYIESYQKQQATLLKRRGRLVADHPAPVSTTFSLSFEKVEQTDQTAADLLHLFAFLDPDAIPEDLLIEGASEPGSTLESMVIDPLAFDEALSVLRTYSLVRRNPEEQTFTMHRLVQAVLKARMDEESQRAWAERAVCVVNRALPEASVLSIGPTWRRYLPQAQVCGDLIERWQMSFPEAIRLLHQTGVYLKEQAQYAQAERFLCKAHDLRMQVLGPQHPAVAESLHELAELAEHQGKYPQAESLYRQALAIREQALGPEHLDVAATLHGLAVFHYYHGPYAQAEQLYRQALSIRENILGSEHPLVAMILNDLALLYHDDQGKDAQAERLYRQALTIFEKTVGPRHPLFAVCLQNLAKLYNDQGRYLQAEPLHQRALAINEETLGPEHPNLAFNLYDLAIINQARGDYAQAERLHRRALALNEQAVGPEHSDVANCLNGLGQCYLEQGRYEEAEPLLTRALAIFEQTREPGYVYTGHCLRNLGRLYVAQARYQQAEPLFERALAIFEQTQGPEHPEVATLLEHYTVLLMATQREAEAAQLRARAEAIRANYARLNQLPE